MKQNFVLGAGRIYLALLDADGQPRGERYVGDTPGFRPNVTNQSVQKFTSDGPVAELAEDVTTQVVRESVIEMENIDDDNLALFFQAERETVTGGGGSVTEEAHTVSPGRYYQLGQDADNPTGVRNVSAVTVTDADSSTAYSEGTDYEVDPELGRLFIVEGGGIAADTAVLVDYTEGSGSRSRLVSSEAGPALVALRYIADNSRGENRDLYAPRVQLRADGETAFKSRDTWQRLTFRCQFMRPDSGAALYIDGRPVAAG